ncbi:quercetin dioxygenase-like cupin family protein [Nonomuraea fuscirosea]|uniref:Quercetin dioxygenase-like cupin family protein n=2 Tax=Nonomuraea fuscirosea TaxID=1291556 RepID=A0A2T0MR53_9ACTN|nr:quercetin dioxygenase-like cupin family protein [Nonomuraea fuscirosea]
MMRVRPVCALLAAGMVAATAACGPAGERATAERAAGERAAAGRAPVAVAPVTETPPGTETPVTTGTPTATGTQPPEETVKTLLEQPLPGVKGKTFTSKTVAFPPGGRSVPHRHGNAFVYAYVVEGTMRSQLGGEPVRTYRQGEFWVEAPGAHHVLTENASQSEPAKLVVVYISNTGEKLKVDD